MKPRAQIIVIFVFLIFSCNDDQVHGNTCSIENPILELDWLESEIQTLEQSELSQFFYVSQAQYKNETVFIFGNCCPGCFSILPVYNCSGEFIGSNVDLKIPVDNIIWQPENFVCFQK